MNASVEYLILEHLKVLRDGLRDFKADVQMRLNSLENQSAATARQLAFIHEDIAGIHARLDHFDSGSIASSGAWTSAARPDPVSLRPPPAAARAAAAR